MIKFMLPASLVFFIALAISALTPRVGAEKPPPAAEASGPGSELIEGGNVHVKLMVQEQHIVELRNRVEALESAVGAMKGGSR